MDLIERIATALENPGFVAAGARIGVAVSGGADSVFLCRAMAQLSRAVCILHVNHQLRAEESDDDEIFVRNLARELNLPIYVQRWAGVPEGNLEQEARRARHALYAGSILAGHCEVVATGHTLDDQAETVLYRFLRGAGTAGLSGILPRTAEGVVRPLLEVRRREIREWLTARNFAWREDASNAGMNFARNRIRLRYLPSLVGDLNPALPETLANTARWARDEEEYWNAELSLIAETHLTCAPETVLLNTVMFNRLAIAVQRRLLRRAVEHVRESLRSIDFGHVEAIRGLMQSREGSGRLQAPGLDIYRSFDWVRLAPPGFDSRVERDFEIPLQVPGITTDKARRLAIEVELSHGPHVYNIEVSGLDGERCEGLLSLRNWRPGDRIQPSDRAGSEKIKTLFQECRVPLWERRRWPVVTRGESIIWTRGFGAARDFAATAGSRSILTIRELTESNPLISASMKLKRARCPEPATPGAEVL